MVAIFQKQPDSSLRGPINWSLFLGWEGEPLTSAPIYLPVTFDDTGQPYTPQTPKAPILSAVLTSRTTVTIDWAPSSDTSGPAIQFWEIDVQSSTDNGVNYGAWAPISGSPFDHDVYTTGLVALATGTPEVKFRYRCRAINGDGNGEYSMYEVQWNGTITNPPNPPRTLVVTNITSTSVRLSWTASVGAATDGATKYGIWEGNVDRNVPIDPNATSFVWSNLTPGSPYRNINIRRFNAGGWSGGTNWADFDTLGVPRITVDDPVLGQSVPDDSIAQNIVYRTAIPAIRIYAPGDMTGAGNKVNMFDPRVVAYTDPWSTGAPGSISLAYVDHVKTMLDTFNQVAANLDREVHVAYGNEIDRDWQGAGALTQPFIDVYAALRDLIWGTTGGVRDYPNASVWVDMTANNIRTNGSGPQFKPIAKYLDGMACSFYPAGRTIGTGNPLIEYDPSGYPAGSLWSGNTRNRYSYYIDPIFAALHDWRTTGGVGGTNIAAQLNQIACWEIGIPIHHSLDGTTSPWVRTGTVGTATDLTQKPRYLVGGGKVTGPADQQYNFEGFLPYVWKKCVAEDVSMREMLYWNQQSNPQIPNLWQTDHGLTPIDSVTAWYTWFPGYRMADI